MAALTTRAEAALKHDAAATETTNLLRAHPTVVGLLSATHYYVDTSDIQQVRHTQQIPADRFRFSGFCKAQG